MNYTINDIYKSYSDYNIDKEKFINICSEFNIMIIESILEGYKFNMGNNLSSISIVRLTRDPHKPTIDWGESNKYKKELLKEGKELYNLETDKGIKWYIYYTDTEYCRYYWNKGKCRITNKSVYKFIPTRGIKGNKEKLINLLKEDDLSYLRFKKIK